MATSALAVLISAILDHQAPEIRTAFRRMVEVDGHVGLDPATTFAVARELCLATLDDIETMPKDMCKSLHIPEGSTYARGANAWLNQTFQPNTLKRLKHMR